jgi:hypothetical protein
MFGLLLLKHTNCLATYPPLPPGAYDAPPTTRSPAMTALCLSSVTADAVCPLPAHSRGAHFNSRHMAIPAHFRRHLAFYLHWYASASLAYVVARFPMAHNNPTFSYFIVTFPSSTSIL